MSSDQVMQIPQETAFMIAICYEPEADDHKLIYADWLEDQGLCYRAAAWRWIVRNQRVPLRYHHGRYGWIRWGDDWYSKGKEYLPHLVFRHLMEKSPLAQNAGHALCPSMESAWSGLVEILVEMMVFIES